MDAMEKRAIRARSEAERLTHFIDASPTPFHATATLKCILENASFKTLPEDDEWDIVSGGRYVVTRNESAIVAFAVGSKPTAESGFKIVGAHTDSPNLRLKPKPIHDKSGYMQLAVEPYGGLILASWLNRDLSIAGRVIIRSENGHLYGRLVNIKRPILSLPQLAIHLDREINEKGLVLNKQTHISPIIALTKAEVKSEERFHALLRRVAGIELKPEEQIAGTDLALYDTQPSTVGGLEWEFIYAPRLDNLASCHAAVMALDDVIKPLSTCVVICYDNEEVGSQTAQGAQSPFLRDILERIAGTGNVKRTIARSFCISADMAHAVHPNYADKHEPRYMPIVGGGPVIKTNVNQRYATTGLSAAFFAELCKRTEVPYQNFVSRSDLACGTTIDPIMAAELGILTVDVGNPMLSMHSAREQAGVADHIAMIDVLKTFFANETVNPQIT